LRCNPNKSLTEIFEEGPDLIKEHASLLSKLKEEYTLYSEILDSERDGYSEMFYDHGLPKTEGIEIL